MYFKVWISTSCNHEMNAGFESMLVLMINVQYHSKMQDLVYWNSKDLILVSWDLKLDSLNSKLEWLEFHDTRIKSRDTRIKSFEFQ